MSPQCILCLCCIAAQLSSSPDPSKLDPTRFGLQPDPERTRFKTASLHTADSTNQQIAPEGFTISQLQGTQFKKDPNGLSNCKEGDVYLPHTSLFIRKESRLELTTASGEILRIGENTNIDIEKKRTLKIFKGAILLSVTDKTPDYNILSPLSKIQIGGDGAAMFAVTEVGGLKVICINGELEIAIADKISITLKPGQLVFVFTEGKGFSRIVDLELATVMQTSSLISDFMEPLPFLEELAKNARNQNRKIRGRFKALVGDAKTNQDFELMILKDKSPPEHSETENP
jgi:hypothetical protein